MIFKILLSIFCSGFIHEAKAISSIADMNLSTLKQTPEYVETKELCSDVKRPELSVSDMKDFRNIILTSWRMHRAYQKLFFSGLQKGFDYGLSREFFRNMASDGEEFSSPVKKLFASEGFDLAMKECFNGKMPVEAHAFMLSRLMADVLGQSSQVVLTLTVLKTFKYVRLGLVSRYGKWPGNLIYSGGVFGLMSYSTYILIRDFNENLMHSLNPGAESREGLRKKRSEMLLQMRTLLVQQKNADHPNEDLIERLQRRISEIEKDLS